MLRDRWSPRDNGGRRACRATIPLVSLPVSVRSLVRQACRLASGLVLAGALVATPVGAVLTPGTLRLDANFHTIGVRASFTTADGASGNAATVEYRRLGESAWRTAPPVWLDVRPTLAYAGGAPNWARDEARTKIFGLTPGVAYEVRATFAGSVAGTASVLGAITTRALAPPEPSLRTLYVDGVAGDDDADGTDVAVPKRTIAAAFALARAGDTIAIAPGSYTVPTRLMLAASGTPAQWIRVTRWPGSAGEVVLEGAGTNDSVLVLGGSYVRVDGLTIRRALGSCLRVEGGTTDHWIDGNVITDWNADDDPGVQHEGGIAAWSNAARLVAMDNVLKRRDVLPGPQHGGGNGVWVKNQTSAGSGGGQHVVRGNVIIGGWDGVGSDVEADPLGGFLADSDVYENIVSDTQDDGIQMEGADVNCAVFANVVRRGRTGIAFAPVGVGPLFVMRNRHVSPTWTTAGPFYKVGALSDGRVWLFHESAFDAAGADGIAQTNPGFANLVSRNNAWQTGRYVVETTTATAGPVPDFDWDALFTTDGNGRFVKWFGALRASLAAFQSGEGQEPHGTSRDLAALDWAEATNGGFALRPGSALRDAGVAIAGVNDDLEDGAWSQVGSAPDVGALEATGDDDAAPTVTMTAPNAGATVAGLVDVAVDAADDRGVTSVLLYVDGTLAAVAKGPPWILPWRTATLADGGHVVAAEATDAAGNVTRTSDVVLLVDNGRGGGRSSRLCLKTKAANGFARRTADVTDASGTRALSIVRPVAACDPAFQGGGAFVDASDHLTCYAVKPLPGAARETDRVVDLADAFGDLRLELRKSIELCVPATRDGGTLDLDRDAFLCRQTRTVGGTPRFGPRAIDVTTPDGTRALVVQKPYAFCAPARLGGRAPSDPAARIACYRAKLAPGTPRAPTRTVTTTDGFGAQALATSAPHRWCQPAAEVP